MTITDSVRVLRFASRAERKAYAAHEQYNTAIAAYYLAIILASCGWPT
jgi:uncharacterized membrane protein